MLLIVFIVFARNNTFIAWLIKLDTPVFNKMGLFLNEILSNSEKLYEKGFYVASGLTLKEEQIVKVLEVLYEILK